MCFEPNACVQPSVTALAHCFARLLVFAGTPLTQQHHVYFIFANVVNIAAFILSITNQKGLHTCIQPRSCTLLFIVEIPKKSRRTSIIWRHFEKSVDTAQCRHCNLIMSARSGATGNLLRHLRKKHHTKISKRNAYSVPRRDQIIRVALKDALQRNATSHSAADDDDPGLSLS